MTERVQLTAQLVPGKDDDLIEWFMTLPDKGRNRAIKNMLRRGLGLPEDESENTQPMIAIHQDGANDERVMNLEQMIQDLYRRLDDQGNYFEQRLAGYNPAPANGKKAKPENHEKREANLRKADW